MGENVKIKITLFKESGKYYTEETVEVPADGRLPDEPMPVNRIADWLENEYRSYKGMHLVAMLDELPNGYPVMIPAGRRN